MGLRSNQELRTVTDLKQDLASLRIDRGRSTSGRSVQGRWRWSLFVFVPIVLGLGVLYALRARNAFLAVEVTTVRASAAQAPQAVAGTPILSATGYVVPRRKAVVSAKIQGRLAELRVEEGSRVEQGEVLARLESANYEAQVRQAEASVQRAEADLSESRRLLRQNEGLAREKVVSQDQLEAARSRVQISEAALAQAGADLALSQALYRDTLIKAPFTGVVLKKMAEVGESVAPIPPGVNISTSSGAIVALADLDTLEVEADVSESNVAKLGPDQPAEVAVEAFPDRRYKAVLRQIIPTADRTKATVQVKVTILDKDGDLRPEMTARVTFIDPGHGTASASGSPVPSVTVPEGAVVTRDGKSLVFEVRGGKVKERAVVTGTSRQGQIVVREGLVGSETLVLEPPATLRDGDAVRIKG